MYIVICTFPDEMDVLGRWIDRVGWDPGQTRSSVWVGVGLCLMYGRESMLRSRMTCV